MKKIISTILAFLFILSPLISSAQLRTFTSGQVGTSATNGYVLQTNGATSTWVATSTLGFGVGGGGTWGSITGTLSDQTDLQSALDAKLSTTTAASTYLPLSASTSLPYLKLDQTTPQTVINGIPYFSVGLQGALYDNASTPVISIDPNTRQAYDLASAPNNVSIDWSTRQLQMSFGGGAFTSAVLQWNSVGIDGTPRIVISNGVNDGTNVLSADFNGRTLYASDGTTPVIDFTGTTTYLTTVTADLASYVKYTGATGDVDLGVYDLTTTGNIYNKADNSKHYFGSADDASIYFNATNLVINPLEVGPADIYFGTSGNTVGLNNAKFLRLGTDVAPNIISEYGNMTPSYAINPNFVQIVKGNSNYAVIAGGSTLYLETIDVTDKTAPVSYGYLELDIQTNWMVSSYNNTDYKNYMYIIGFDGSSDYYLEAIDVSDPANPVVADKIATVTVSDVSQRVWVDDSTGYAYVLNNNGTVQIFNVSDPTNISKVFDGDLDAYSGAAICAYGNLMILSTTDNGGNSFTTYDVTDRANPIKVTVYNTNYTVMSMDITEWNFYANAAYDILSYSISGTTLTLIKTEPTYIYSSRLKYYNNEIWLSSSSGSYGILKTSTIGNNVFGSGVADFDIGGSTFGVTVDGTGENKFRTANVSPATAVYAIQSVNSERGAYFKSDSPIHLVEILNGTYALKVSGDSFFTSITTGNIYNKADNSKHYFGTGDDASIYYNGTDLIIDPKEGGSGRVNLNGGNLYTTGTGIFKDVRGGTGAPPTAVTLTRTIADFANITRPFNIITDGNDAWVIGDDGSSNYYLSKIDYKNDYEEDSSTALSHNYAQFVKDPNANILFMISADGYLGVWDINNVTFLSETSTNGSNSISYNSNNLVAVGGVSYVDLWDVTNRAAPSSIASISVATNWVHLSSDRLVIGGSDITIYDVSTPASPTLLATISQGSTKGWTDGSTAIILNSTTLHIYTVSDNYATWTLTKTFNLPTGNWNSLTTTGSTAYVADGGQYNILGFKYYSGISAWDYAGDIITGQYTPAIYLDNYNLLSCDTNTPVGLKVWDITTITGSAGVKGTKDTNTYAGYFNDNINEVKIGDGTYALNIIGDVKLANELFFRDTDIYISSLDDGHLDLMADVSIDFNTAADTDLVLNFFGTSNSGVLTWMEYEDYFQFADVIKSAGRQRAVTTKTTTYTITKADEVIVCNSTTPFTVTLPVATGSGQTYAIKNINTGAVTVEGDSSDTIDGSLNQSLNQWDDIQLTDYAANAWVII